MRVTRTEREYQLNCGYCGLIWSGMLGILHGIYPQPMIQSIICCPSCSSQSQKIIGMRVMKEKEKDECWDGLEKFIEKGGDYLKAKSQLRSLAIWMGILEGSNEHLKRKVSDLEKDISEMKGKYPLCEKCAEKHSVLSPGEFTCRSCGYKQTPCGECGGTRWVSAGASMCRSCKHVRKG